MAANTGIYYNDGLAQSYNSILLKNVIRAAKGYPLYYSALGAYSRDNSTDLQASPSVQIPFNVGAGALIDGEIDVGLAPSASVTRDHNANASSLEIEQFTQAMHTQVSGKTLLFFSKGRNRSSLNLLLMLLVERLTVTGTEFDEIISGAYVICRDRAARLSAIYRGICRNLVNPETAILCADHPSDAGVSRFAVLRNDPTNPCEFALFKLFVEAAVLGEPRAELQNDGSIAFAFGEGQNGPTLFKTEKTGLVLRSPHEAIHYLGKIVRQTFLDADQGLLTVTATNGKDVPIILIEEGKGRKKAAIAATIDNETFWIPQQNLRSVETHFSFTVLGVLKDIISLNTSPNQLPSSPTRVVVN